MYIVDCYDQTLTLIQECIRISILHFQAFLGYNTETVKTPD